jgi:anti-sigma-K factor RskA
MGAHDHMEQAFEVVRLRCTQAVPNATGQIMISKDGRFALLVVMGLPVLDPEYKYQLWLVRDGQRTSGGMFTVTSEGYGSMTISLPQSLSDYSYFDITIEPAEGSPEPTGEKVLVARV